MKEPKMYPMELKLKVKFYRYPPDLYDGQYDDEQIMDNFESAGEGAFLWEPGRSTIDPKTDLLLAGSDRVSLYPLRDPPYYVTHIVMQERLEYLLQKQYKRMPSQVRVEIAYLQDALEKWEVLARLLGVIKEE